MAENLDKKWHKNVEFCVRLLCNFFFGFGESFCWIIKNGIQNWTKLGTKNSQKVTKSRIIIKMPQKIGTESAQKSI